MNLYAGLWGGLMQPAYERLRGRLTPGLRLRLEQSQYWPLEVLARQQWQDLKALLNLARERVPFYADWFANSGITVEDITRARDLSPLPVIGREELMAEPGRFQANPKPAGAFAKATGGSTGRPLKFLVDPASDQWRLAMSRRGYAWAGCRPGVRQVYLWAGDFTPPPGLARLKRGLHRGLMGQIYLDCFDMTPAQMERAIKVISRFRPACLVAFTSAALILARHAKARGWRPPASLRSLIVGAEALHAPGRQALEAAFGCPVFETYGSREFMLMAAECPMHQGLHLSMENLYIEILAEGRPAQPGQVGQVVVTDLHNSAQPFIRYQNGDLASLAQGICPCGRTLPRLAGVEGRILDQLTGPDGRRLSGTIFPHLLKDFAAIESFQAQQDRLDHLTLRLVLRAPLADDQRRQIARAVGGALPGVEIAIQVVERIPPTPSGKHRVTIGLGQEDRP